MIETVRYVRKSFPVDAIQVTDTNMEEIAEWCSGVVEEGDDGGRAPYIRIEVHNPMTERQTKAFEGDWVLYAGTGFKVYPEKAFQKSFEMVPITTKVSPKLGTPRQLKARQKNHTQGPVDPADIDADPFTKEASS